MDHDHGTKVLLIEDEESIRTLLCLSLNKKGLRMIAAEDGLKGLEVFKRERPSIVITDVKMPGMDGIEVLKRVRELEPDTRVIVITGHGDMETAIKALKLDASDFISKPIKVDALMLAVKRAEETLWVKSKLREYTGNLERKVMEATQELREAAAFQKNLIESSIDGIIGIDRSGTILIFNRAAETLTGFKSEDVINRASITEIYHPSSVAREVKKKMYGSDYGGTGRVLNLEVAVNNKNGQAVPIRLSATLLYKNGEEIGSVGFFQDLSPIKRLQKELIEKERLSAIGQTVAGMGHYIKNILNGLEGGIYMVNTGLRRDKQPLVTEGWGNVQKNVSKISDLVLNMLSYSRKREPEPELCSPNEVAQEVFELMEETAKKANISFKKAFDPSIEPCYMDPTGIHRCLLNLVANAIDACVLDRDENKDHTVLIGTSTEKSEIRYRIRDNGMGMTDEVQEKLFDRFFSTKGSKGSGFGLLVTRKIIEEHEGRISFESQQGKGTTLTIHLPYRRLHGQ